MCVCVFSHSCSVYLFICGLSTIDIDIKYEKGEVDGCVPAKLLRDTFPTEFVKKRIT